MLVSYSVSMELGYKHGTASTGLIARIILQSRKLRRIKQEVLAPAVGCSRSYISKLEKGHVLPSLTLATNLEKALNLKDGSLVKLVRDIKKKEAELRHQTRQHVRDARKGRIKFLLSENVLIPLYITRKGIWNDQIHRYVAIPKNQLDGSQFFLYEVPDDSMDKAGIRKDDLVLVENRNPRNGEICVFCVLKKCFIRYCQRQKRSVDMIPRSSNPMHKILRYKNLDAIDLKGSVRGLYLTHGSLAGQWKHVANS
jgi:transcriptional regulator with XRE-family HTH domain